METVEMTWLRTFKIWWFWAWRTMLAALLVSVVLGLLLGLLLFPFLGSEAAAKLIGNLVGGAVGIAIGLWVLKTLPEKEFSDFRVVLVPRDAGERSVDG